MTTKTYSLIIVNDLNKLTKHPKYKFMPLRTKLIASIKKTTVLHQLQNITLPLSHPSIDHF